MKKGVKQIVLCYLNIILVLYLIFCACDKSSSKHPLEPPDDNPQSSDVPTLLSSGEFGISGQEYVLNWTSISEAESYILQEATKITFEDSISTTLTDTTVAILKEVQLKQQFYYRVKAVNGELCSAWSDTVNIDVYPIVMPRPVLHGPEGTIGSGDMYTLQWTNYGDSYTLEESPTIFFSNAVNYSVNDTLKVLHHTKSEGQIFCYRVKANGVPGVYDSQWSNSISLVVLGKIAFTSDRDGNPEIYVMNEDGTNQRNLSNNAATDNYPSWSPDGTQLAFRTTRERSLGNICIMNADGTNQRILIDLSGFPLNFDPFGNITYPSWSYDVLKIMFSAAFVSRPNGDIYIINTDGTNLIRVTQYNNSPNYSEPSWSPDGSHIAYVASIDNGNKEIFLMNSDGSNERNISNHPNTDTNPSWSPDGTQIAFQSQRDFNMEIYVMNADGSNPRNLTNYWAMDSEPSWSSDGTQIVFTSNRSGKSAICIMNADGSKQKNLTFGTDSDSQPSWCPK